MGLSKLFIYLVFIFLGKECTSKRNNSISVKKNGPRTVLASQIFSTIGYGSETCETVNGTMSSISVLEETTVTQIKHRRKPILMITDLRKNAKFRTKVVLLKGLEIYGKLTIAAIGK